MGGPVMGGEVLALLGRLEASGVRLALTPDGAGLRVLGKGKPAPDVLAEVKAQKPALLAWLRGEDPAGGGQTVPPLEGQPEAARASLPTLPARGTGEEKTAPAGPAGGAVPAPSLPSPEGQRPTRPARTLEEWQAEAAQPGRCGSCARARPADPEDGPLMVRCGADPVAWWPLSPPFAVHIGAKCGAYLLPGEEIGQGYRSREAAQTWGTGQHAARPASGAHRGGRA